MRRTRASTFFVLMSIVVAGCVHQAPPEVLETRSRFTNQIALPPPDTRGSMPLDQAIAQRRSVREFRDEPVSLELIGQLLWAAQGVTDPSGKRAAPSAGAVYPLELYVVTPDQVLHYLPAGHRAEVAAAPDHRPALERAAHGQTAVGSAPAVVVVAAVPERTRAKYGAQADDFVNREAGHATENLLLEATSRGLGAVTIGAFDGPGVATELVLPPDEEVLGLVPIGYPAP